jgi:hypothetical protein
MLRRLVAYIPCFYHGKDAAEHTTSYTTLSIILQEITDHSFAIVSEAFAGAVELGLDPLQRQHDRLLV